MGNINLIPQAAVYTSRTEAKRLTLNLYKNLHKNAAKRRIGDCALAIQELTKITVDFFLHSAHQTPSLGPISSNVALILWVNIRYRPLSAITNKDIFSYSFFPIPDPTTRSFSHRPVRSSFFFSACVRQHECPFLLYYFGHNSFAGKHGQCSRVMK